MSPRLRSPQVAGVAGRSLELPSASPNGLTGWVREGVASYSKLVWPPMEANWSTVMSGDVTAGSFDNWIVVLRGQSAPQIRINAWLFQNCDYLN